MDTIKMQEDIRYVAGTMEDIPMFIMNDVTNNRFSLTDNIAVALKSPQKSAIKQVAKFYNQENIPRKFSILPIKVTYQIIDGDDNGTSGVN